MKPGLRLSDEAVQAKTGSTWPDLRTNVEIYFYPKGHNKSQVVVQYGKLPDAQAVE